MRADKFFIFKRKLTNRYRSTKLRIFQHYLPLKHINKLKPNHPLNGQLIVSLTSYPPRFKTLHLTLICLLLQSIKPDKIILWIAEDDRPKLPNNVKKLSRYGLEIKTCDDLRSYKKIIPTLKEYPDAYVVTADDDLYYWNTWLEELVASYNARPVDVICHRAHKIVLDNEKLPLPYAEWLRQVPKEIEHKHLLPTTGAGTLYAPGIFFKDVTNNHIFMDLAPTSDDIWLYWMHSLNSSNIRTLGAKKIITWFQSQEISLWTDNGGELQLNDIAIQNMMKEYGFAQLNN